MVVKMLRRKILSFSLVLVMIISILSAMSITAQAESYGFLQKNPNLTEGQKNIVLRARQIYEIEWTPKRDVIRWGGRGHFKAGVTVKGLPYGMPSEENYVPLRTSFAQFLREVDNRDSKLYTSRATRTAVAPYFSLDCSAFVSWAWGLSSRHMTGALPRVSRNIGKNLRNIQVGDALNKSGKHVVLVTDIRYDGNGEIASVGIMELYVPKAIYTQYGQHGTQPLRAINSKYLNNGYNIIRYNNRESVKYRHDCVVPIDDDYCDKCDNRESAFNDVLNRAVAFDAIHWAHSLGIATGSNGYFSPNNPMTRAQFALVMYRYAGRPMGAPNSKFIDVPNSSIAFDAINWANSKGIVTGQGDRFNPNGFITRAQMVLMLYRYNKTFADRNTFFEPNVLNVYSDRGFVSPTAFDAMRWAVTHRLMTGGDGKLTPNGNVTRAQAVLILYRYERTIAP